jgi:hypothetical protein
MNKEKAATLLDRCLEWLLYLLILLIPVSKAAIEIIFTMAMFVFAAKKILEPDFRFLKNRTHIFLFLFF